MELVNREEFNKHAKEAKDIREALRYPPHVREEWEDLYKTHKMVGAFKSLAKIVDKRGFHTLKGK